MLSFENFFGNSKGLKNSKRGKAYADRVLLQFAIILALLSFQIIFKVKHQISSLAQLNIAEQRACLTSTFTSSRTFSPLITTSRASHLPRTMTKDKKNTKQGKTGKAAAPRATATKKQQPAAARVLSDKQLATRKAPYESHKDYIGKGPKVGLDGRMWIVEPYKEGKNGTLFKWVPVKEPKN